jgi:hypothetical protein
VGLVGCDSGDGGLTAPASTGSASPANFWVSSGGDKLGVYSGEDFLQIQVPAGAFMLEYITDLGIFQIVFSSEDGAFLAIGLLPGDKLHNVNLYEGTVPEGVTPDQTCSVPGVSIFYWPGSTTVLSWGNVFVINPLVAVIVIMQNGVLVLSGDFEIIELPEPVEPKEYFTIETWVNDETLGYITPEGPIERPAGSSKSFQIHHKTRDLNLGDPLQQYPPPDGHTEDFVFVNKVNMNDYVQMLGNGDGHLVIHGIDMDIEIEIYLAP